MSLRREERGLATNDPDAEKLQEIATAELEEAAARFWAKAGIRADIEEHFAHAVARWLAEWTWSFLLPADTPHNVEWQQQWLARVERVRRDLELQGEEGGA
jgi:hypothetical protein